jgi:hypothetical protein
MFQVTIGEKGLGNSHQDDFPPETECVHCKGKARIGFVCLEKPHAAEEGEEGEDNYVCHLHPNDPGGTGFWLHDCCAVAVYFCKKCLQPTALANQA